MPIFCVCVWFNGQHGAPPPPSLPTVDRKVREIEFLLEPVKCIIADDAGEPQLAKRRAAASQRRLNSACTRGGAFISASLRRD